ncbi:hypothetical protein VTO42DRAFT_2164 [Malbranchea cinnamomea]
MPSSSVFPFNIDNDRRQRILILGAGAAGMACAEMLSREPNKYHVTILERNNYVGGQATSLPIDSVKHGVDWVNNGVQFAGPNCPHTKHFLHEYGYELQEVKHQMAFGKGAEYFWTNVFPSPLIKKHEQDIKRFGKVIHSTKLPGDMVWRIPLKTYLYLLGFHRDFANKIIYPLASSLIGVGNHGDLISVGLAQWLFDPERRQVWEYKETPFQSALQSVYTLPNMGRFYQDWAQGLRSRGVKIRLNTQAIRVIERNKNHVVVETRSAESDPRIDSEGHSERSMTENYDTLVMCVHADEAKRILGKQATRLEKRILGSVEFFDDLTVTHTDHAYFQKKYEVHFKEELCAEPTTKEEEERIKFAKGEMGRHSGFRPAYCTYSYHSRPDKVELAFDCSNLQYQFQTDPEGDEDPIPYENHIFQSHFMNEKLKDVWTIDQINAGAIIEQKWWRQPLQSWKHWIKVTPFLKHINGNKNTLYAGAWTTVNIHEFALGSGVAVAYRLGARYEGFTEAGENILRRCLSICHGKRFARNIRK